METDARSVKGSFTAIGEKLRKARENRSITIDQVQKQTHIHSSVLNGLEDGSFYAGNTPTYARSFLKKYAAFLGLDAEAISKEYADIRPQEAVVTPDAKGPDILSKAIYFISVAIILIACLLFLSFLWKKITPLFTKPRVAKTAQLTKAKTVPYKASSAARSASRKETSPQFSIPKNTPLNLTLKTKDPVLIQLKRDGAILFERVLPKGSVETFTADNKFELFIRKAEAVEITVNGKYLGSPGKGVIKNLEITRKGIRIK